MSDIRFNQWLHQSGTGGVSQVDGGHVGIGTTNPDIAVHTANTKKINVGIVTANSVFAGNFYGDGSNLTGISAGVSVANQADDRLITATGTSNALNAESSLTYNSGGLVINSGDLYLNDSIIHGGNTPTKIRFPSVNTISMETNGSERFRIDSNGNMGLGTLLASDAGSAGAGLKIEKYVQRNNIYAFPDGYYGASLGEVQNTENKVWASIDSHYSRSSAVSAGIFLSAFHADAGGSGCGSAIKNLKTGNALTFSTVTTGASVGSVAVETERLRITSSGQLLMGETSAVDSNTAVQITKNVSGNNARFIFRNNANNSASRVRLECMTLNRAANADTFSGIEKYQDGGMHIFNGESTNQYSGISLICGNHNVFRLKNGNHSGHDCAHIQAIWGTSNGLHMEQGGPQSGTHKAIRFTTSHYGGERGYIGVTLGGTSYNSSSDYRQKQDVVDLTGAIDRVKSFKPRRFKWNDDPTYTVDGFLAHEAQTVVPESVVGEKDAVDKNGDPEYQVIDQSKLVPLLTAALQEAITEIETLKTKVAALEGS